MKKKEEVPIFKIIKTVRNMENKPYSIPNILTGLLAVGTIIIAISTFCNVRNQQLQFQLVNRAKIFCSPYIIGDVNGGLLYLTNQGDLPAEDFKLIWKYIDINDRDNLIKYPTPISKTNILSHGGKEKREENVITPDMKIVIKIECSEVRRKQQGIILFVAYKYKCQGIEKFRREEYFYYWNEAAAEPKWVCENYNLAGSDVVIIDGIKKQLKQFLKQDENN